jgi:glutamyl-tRNA(Gln) amidotransferase subunit D
VYITGRDGMAVVKLDSGYNIGVPPASCTLMDHPVPVPSKQHEVVQNKNLPTLAIISTGGTIASRIDYRTGSVTSQFNASDILTAIPELAEIASYRTIPLATILSENMTPAIWQDLARAVHAEITNGAKGVIVTHGTDTMEETARVLGEAAIPKTIVLTGAMIPFKFGSSDGLFNLGSALAFAQSLPPGVYVAMNGRYFQWNSVRKNKKTGEFEEK